MKKVLVTGGSSGIGKAICEHLLSKGFQVLGTSRNPKKHPQSKVELLQLDVTNSDSIKELVTTIQEKWGGLDVLINNAGIGFMGPLESATAENIKQAWETNVFGLMMITQHFIPLLKQTQSSRIINIGSIGGKMGLPFRGWYSAAKGSLEVLGETLAMELKAYNVQVCTLLPGDVKTDIAESRLEPTDEELGDYMNAYKSMKKILSKEMSSATSPETIALVIEKLLRKKKMPLKKSVGSFLHKLTPIIKNLLPQRTFQRLILRHYKQD